MSEAAKLYEELGKPLHFGGNSEIPRRIAICPECGSTLHAESIEHVTKTGEPTLGGLNVYCQQEEDQSTPHKNWQSDWQPVVNAINNWCGAVEN